MRLVKKEVIIFLLLLSVIFLAYFFNPSAQRTGKVLVESVSSTGSCSEGDLSCSGGGGSSCGDCRCTLEESTGACPLDCDLDSDRDCLPDQWELMYFNSISLYTKASDPDLDLLSNTEEYKKNTFPNTNDTDYDTLTDYAELFIYRTNPLNPDSDHDGLNDGRELFLSQNPLSQNFWDFSFKFQNVAHTRFPRGLRVTDSSLGRLEVMPWIEVTEVVRNATGRHFTYFDIAKNSIPLWKDAGATHIGIVGVYGWMQDQDPSLLGYQNSYISELKQLADTVDIEIIFGIKLDSLANSWTDFFAPPGKPGSENDFQKIGMIMNGITSSYGINGWIIEINEWIIEAEVPMLWLRDATQTGALNFTAEDLRALKTNLGFLNTYSPALHWWPSPLYISSSGAPFPLPSFPRSLTNAQKFAYTQVFLSFHQVFGDRFMQMPTGATRWYVLSGKRTFPFDTTTQKTFQTLDQLGAYNYQFNAFVHHPFRYISETNPQLIGRGAAELISDVPYLYGYTINNALYQHLPFQRVILYPGAQYFDIVPLGISHFVDHGFHVFVSSQSDLSQEIEEGERVTITLSAFNGLTTVRSFSYAIYKNCEPVFMQYCSPFVFPSSAKPSFVTTPQQAVLSWKPDFLSGDPVKNYYWIMFYIDDGTNVISYPVPFIVANTLS